MLTTECRSWARREPQAAALLSWPAKIILNPALGRSKALAAQLDPGLGCCVCSDSTALLLEGFRNASLVRAPFLLSLENLPVPVLVVAALYRVLTIDPAWLLMSFCLPSQVGCKALVFPTQFKTQKYYDILKQSCPELEKSSPGGIKSKRWVRNI